MNSECPGDTRKSNIRVGACQDIETVSNWISDLSKDRTVMSWEIRTLKSEIAKSIAEVDGKTRDYVCKLEEAVLTLDRRVSELEKSQKQTEAKPGYSAGKCSDFTPGERKARKMCSK